MNFRKNDFLRKLKELSDKAVQFGLEHSKIVYPVILIVFVAVIVLVALTIGNKEAGLPQDGVNPEQISDNVSGANEIPLPETALEHNAYADVNTLIVSYYEAVANGDVDAVTRISNNVEDAEKKRIAELSKYVESFPTVEIYSKPGPVEGSHLAYVYTLVKFEGYDTLVPGMQAFYICKNEDGSLYINEGEEEAYIMEYIQGVSLQDDVVELYNKMTVEYNELLLSDEQIGIFLQELAKQIDIAIGEEIAAEMAGEQNVSDNEEVSDGESEANDSQEPVQEPQENVPRTAKATTTVNVRSSDSETADKLGKLEGGTKVTVLEIRANGWAKITYEGKDAYVKAEYLDIAEPGESAEGVTTTGTVTVLTNVNVRSEASESAEKLGIVAGGESLELIEKMSNGWCKVKYNGQIGYVKSDYVQ